MVSILVAAVAISGASITGPALAASGRTALPSPTGPGLAVQAARAAVAAEPGAALVGARRSGRSVEALSLRTERSRTMANPDGSWTLEQSVVPVRVRRADGVWIPIDATLRWAGSVVRPAAVPIDLRFSSGGTGPLAEVRTDAGTLTMSWPGPLPAPTLAGATATYRDVLPDVDLVIQADSDGFRHVLVVKTRRAAADPALRQLRFKLGGTLKAAVDADGNLRFRGAGGREAFGAATPEMWDSTRNPASRDGAGLERASVTGPASGAHRARVGVAVVGSELILTPDEGLLASRSAALPVYIDPAYGYKRFAYTNSGNESNNEIARIGRRPDTGSVYRSFFTYDVSSLRGKHILGAELHTTLTHSYGCSNTALDLYRVGGHGSGRIDWASRPALKAWLDEREGHAHKIGSDGRKTCSDDPQPDMPIEFSGNLTGDLAAVLNDGFREYPIGLLTVDGNGAGSGESDDHLWKKVSVPATQLVVQYNSVPQVPSSLSADGAGCATGSARPVLASTTPVLRVKVADDDSGDNDLKASFAWQHLDTSVNPAVWQTMRGDQQGSLRSGATGQVKITNGLVNGGIYRWQAQTLDPWTYAKSSGVDASAWSAWCEFEVDTVGPGVAPSVTSPVYGTDLNAVYGAVGRTADFTVTASGVADVASYRWGWADPPTTTVTPASLGGQVTLPLTPPPPTPRDPTSGGLLTLYVVSVDRAGRTSPANAYTFNIGSATAPVGKWDMSDPAGSTTLADSSDGGRNATVSGATTGTAGRLVDGPTALSLNGSGNYASAPGVPMDTSTSFSVSAWVRVDGTPTDTGTGRAAVSVTGSRASAFFLRRWHDGRWAFGVAESDVDSATHTNAVSTLVSKPGVWTHLVGVYDAGAKQIRLYVNGVLAATGTQTKAFRATGTVEFGRTKWSGNINFEPLWQGSIAEVRMWNRVVSAEELAPTAATLTGHWALDGDGTDSGPFHRTASGPASVGWVDDRNTMAFSAVSLNGTDEWLTTNGPALRTDQSFTVSAWVNLPAASDRWANVLGQDGVNVSGFYLGYRVYGTTQKWGFLLKNRDTMDNTGSWAYAETPLGDDDIGRWVHLTGVYDAQAAQARLYVDGVLQATVACSMPWEAAGPVTIGRTRYPVGGTPGPAWAWPGAIDDVRTYQGVLPDSEIAALAAQ